MQQIQQKRVQTEVGTSSALAERANNSSDPQVSQQIQHGAAEQAIQIIGDYELSSTSSSEGDFGTPEFAIEVEGNTHSSDGDERVK